ncbi:hypothetical protein ALP80_200180 [Pseudomonas savastanoi pv. fraxini]|nr:hypothetical protein ALP80_200180 [Pseudomonas savastanoi pv. fraxini]
MLCRHLRLCREPPTHNLSADRGDDTFDEGVRTWKAKHKIYVLLSDNQVNKLWILLRFFADEWLLWRALRR